MSITGWITRNSRSRLQPAPSVEFADSPAPGSRQTIAIDDSQRLQVVDGFGFTLTGGSAALIAAMPGGQRAALLQELFGDGDESLGISCLRLTIGASDLGVRSYTYLDRAPGNGEPPLGGFDLFAGDPEVVPILREILAIRPALRLIASPWSAPPWMKTNGGFVSGQLRRRHFQTYADYLTTYLQAMRAHGVNVHAITPQNEPHNPKNEPSMVMSAADQAIFIRDHLGPAFKLAGLEIDVFCWDHNCNEPEFPLAVLGDPLGAEAYVQGVAWHLYQGVPEAIAKVQAAYPEKRMYLTEQWVSMDGDFETDLRWHAKNLFIGGLRNCCRAVLQWNLASSPDGTPHTRFGAPNCLGAVTIGPILERNVGHVLMAHTARLMPPGSVRIASTEPEGLPNVALQTPDQRVVLLVLNEGAEARRFAVLQTGRTATLELPAGAVGTFSWPASPPVA